MSKTASRRDMRRRRRLAGAACAIGIGGAAGGGAPIACLPVATTGSSGTSGWT